MTSQVPPSADAPLIACVDSSQDIVELLRDVFVSEGFRAVPYVSPLAEGPAPMIAFLQGLQPHVCVFNVSVPYPESWAEFAQVRQAVSGCAWVVTTTNKEALDELVGPTDAIEIIGKPFDIDQVVAAVRRALAAG